jgi:hypothetical protein
MPSSLTLHLAPSPAQGFGKHYGASVVAARHLKEPNATHILSPAAPQHHRRHSQNSQNSQNHTKHDLSSIYEEKDHDAGDDCDEPQSLLAKAAQSSALRHVELAKGILQAGDLVMLVCNDESKVIRIAFPSLPRRFRFCVLIDLTYLMLCILLLSLSILLSLLHRFLIAFALPSLAVAFALSHIFPFASAFTSLSFLHRLSTAFAFALLSDRFRMAFASL